MHKRSEGLPSIQLKLWKDLQKTEENQATRFGQIVDDELIIPSGPRLITASYTERPRYSSDEKMKISGIYEPDVF